MDISRSFSGSEDNDFNTPPHISHTKIYAPPETLEVTMPEFNRSPRKPTSELDTVSRQISHLHNRINLLEGELRTLNNRQVYLVTLISSYVIFEGVKRMFK